MTAYSFKRQFVLPIMAGLGIPNQFGVVPPVEPKRQTIRAEHKRHAREGEELQLYCGMRTKGCFLIGRARCTSVERVTLWVGDDIVVRAAGKLLGPRQVSAFARADGFKDAGEMAAFWRVENGVDGKWEGVLIRWEPLR